MKINLDKYKTFIFDCDGIILNSNFIKANCFYLSVIDFGVNVALEFKKYHSKEGGLSRVKKFDYFIETILPKFKISVKNKEELKKNLLYKYESVLRSQIFNSEISSNIFDFKNRYHFVDWIMISGSDQNELREIMNFKKISNLFNLGIFGSPLSKKSLIKNNLLNGKIKMPALFIGDSKLDYYAAKTFNIDFLFLYGWTDFDRWEDFCLTNNIVFTKNLDIYL